MSDPVAYQIVEAVQTRLEAINPSGGYNTDAGDRVHLGQRQVNPDEIDIGPMLFVYDIGDNLFDAGEVVCSKYTINLQIVVEGFVAIKDENAVKVAMLLWQDVIKSAFQSDKTLGGLALSVERGDRSIEYQRTGGDMIAMRQLINVVYLETYGNP